MMSKGNTQQEKKYPKITVGVLMVNENGKVFLATSYKWKGKWVIPGGHVEWGEKLEDAVKRETKEETGIDVKNIQLLNVQESIFSKGFHEERHFIFLDYVCEAYSEDVQLNSELQKYIWVYPKDALNLDIAPSVKNFIECYIEKNEKGSER